MGIDGRPFQPDQTPAPIVAFDFDGTLTWRDSFIDFIAWRAGPARFAAGLIGLAPAAVRYLAGGDRGQLKAATIVTFMRGTSRAQLEGEAQAFADERAAALLRPDAVRCWNRWRESGARLVIVTASPESIVQPFAQRLGAEHLIATQLAFEGDRLTGGLAGANCRGPEKVRALRSVLGPDVHLEAAYGDTAGDREMLTLAKAPGYRVFKQRP